jgi:hypothetical protein
LSSALVSKVIHVHTSVYLPSLAVLGVLGVLLSTLNEIGEVE